MSFHIQFNKTYNYCHVLHYDRDACDQFSCLSPFTSLHPHRHTLTFKQVSGYIHYSKTCKPSHTNVPSFPKVLVSHTTQISMPFAVKNVRLMCILSFFGKRFMKSGNDPDERHSIENGHTLIPKMLCPLDCPHLPVRPNG